MPDRGRPFHDKQDFMRRFYESALYRRALESAGDDEARRRVAAFAGGFVSELADALVPVVQRAQSDPAFAQAVGEALGGRLRLVTLDGPVSGSSEDVDG